MAFIEAIDISKRFNGKPGRETQAVLDLNLTVREKEFISIVGPSGCGKSTFLLMLSGLEKPTSGHITLDGVFVEGPDPQQAVVFQDYVLFPWKTVKGNITFGPKLRGVDHKVSEKISYRYIDLMGLTGFEDRYPHELSGGMQQRVAIARALANDPKVLLMDEPFGSLDALTREVMQMELLKIWRADRCTVLFVTHSINEAVFLSDRVVVMTKRPGRIKTVVDINLDRPRTQDMQLSDQFKNYEMTLKRMVWEEV